LIATLLNRQSSMVFFKLGQGDVHNESNNPIA
jgi:hypothetical protein